MDFVRIAERSVERRGKLVGIDIYPDFLVKRSKDLMVRAKSFYAVWDEAAGMWSTDEYDVRRLVDDAMFAYRDTVLAQRSDLDGANVRVRTLADFSTHSWAEFRKYLSNISDNNHPLDERLTFANTPVKKTDYVSKRLPYALEEGDCSAWTELTQVLYAEDELRKIEWAIGSVVSGDSRDIQKFLVFYGEAGTGKSTILNVIAKLFDGYTTTFEAKALTNSNNLFATEVFRDNPLVAIQHDGDLSRIEDNTKLNSIVSHEMMTMNEKHKPSYTARANCFLFMGTNRPVRITDGKSGVIRRLIDVSPTGKKLPARRYQALMSQIDFQLGAIAAHCLAVYKRLGKHYYDGYRPVEMMLKTDVFYNFVEAHFDIFKAEEGISLSQAYAMYKTYCDEALVDFKLPRHKFREELKNYFERFDEMTRVDGKQVRSWYSGFLRGKFEATPEPKPELAEQPDWLTLIEQPSVLDDILADCPAQYANERETPAARWSSVSTVLKQLDTSKLHYVKVPKQHIVIDFDLKDDQGNKCLEKNLEAASHWPATYAETSKGGQGLHLHYIYEGDPAQLSCVYAEGIEIKVFRGNGSLRRRLKLCNAEPVSTLSGGLPLKGAKMLDIRSVKSEKELRDMIRRNLNKEFHPATKPSCDFIFHLLEEARDSGLHYDVSDLRTAVLRFAMNSTHQSDYCMALVGKMPWRSEEPAASTPANEDDPLVFFDVEVFPNLFLVNWKVAGEGHDVARMINPKPREIEQLFKMKLVGFNCRRYDNHILYARYIGYDNLELFKLSMRIVAGHADAMFSEAYNLSYTDVYDFSSKKQSLKKFEIELGIHHQELGLPWDQPVPEARWAEVAEYCDNDVLATEAVFNARQADWTARRILAAVAGMTVNDTTNSLTQRIIFGGDRHPQSQFNYRFMGDVQDGAAYRIIEGTDPNFVVFDGDKPLFPGYTFERGKSVYRGEEVGEGGYVYAEPGIHTDVALLDIASMHPSSIVAEQLFGPVYTQRFKDILDARIAIKHGDFEAARRMLDGKLAPYLEDESSAKDLAQALKIAINSVYGLTSAKFDNPFRDRRNIDNIVAKRGALFMVNLKHEVQARGFTVAHIKTDSIKIPNATPEIIQFVMDFGREYGYNFEHEATYERMCLVNDAVYIARYADGKHAGEWTATGAQFQQPYVFKTLFSGEPIAFADLCETKSVSSALYLDMNEGLPDVRAEEKELDARQHNAAHPESPKRLNPAFLDISDEALADRIAQGHRYQFIGRVGLFYPVRAGAGGGLLMREKDGRYYAATGTKGYRWLEAETVQAVHKEDALDPAYHNALMDDAIAAIAKFGDFEAFVSESPYICARTANDAPPWLLPCGDGKYNSCQECPGYSGCELARREEEGA